MTIKMYWTESKWEKPDDFIPHTGNLHSDKVTGKSLGAEQESKSSDSQSDSEKEQETKGEISTERPKLTIKFKVSSCFSQFCL